MIWDLFVDFANILHLRFKPLVEYKYHWTTVIGVLVFLGVNTYIIFYPVLGLRVELLLACIFTEFLRCTILSETLRRMLIPATQKFSLFYFIFATEALGLILTVFHLFPQNSPIQILGPFIALWLLMVQIIGVVWHTKAPLLKVFLSYFIYVFVFLFALMIFSGVLVAFGAVTEGDAQRVMEYIQTVQQQAKPK